MKPVNTNYYPLFDSFGIRKGTKSYEKYEVGKRMLQQTADRWAHRGVLGPNWYADGVRALAAWLGI